MRIGVGCLLQESNTFSPLPTTLEEFGLVTGPQVLAGRQETRTELDGFIDVLGRDGHTPVPLFSGFAMTSGPIRRADFATMCELVTRACGENGPLDAILLALHGAMCAEGSDDGSGALLAAIRAAVGPQLPIALTYDLHANVTAAVVRAVQMLVGYQTYPHMDLYETGETAAGLLLRSFSGECRPVLAMLKLPMVVPAETMQTTHGPLAEVQSVAAQWRQRNKPLLSTSVFCVQPWLDVDEMGAAIVAVADNNGKLAEDCVRDVAAALWARRTQFEPELLDPKSAIEKALAEPQGPVILSEPSDSPTAGAPGDSADLVDEFLKRGADVPAAFWVRDAGFVAECWKRRPGDTVEAELGGLLDPPSRRRIRIRGVIRSLSTGRFVVKGAWFHGVELSMGRTAVVSVGRASVIVSESPTAMIDPELYRSQGIEPRDQHIVVVKSATGFRQEYAPFASRIFMVDTPGAASPNLRRLPWRRVSRPIYPLDDAAFNPQTAPVVTSAPRT
jgi:microcystin degradation protein MlrC